MTTPSLTLATLTAACQGSAIALRRRIRLQPAGGPGDKVFPPTYEGGQYALEERVIDGARLPCVLLDSVQSQANRMELALLEAHRSGRITIPVVGVDFSAVELAVVQQVTSLDAPHRLADAILRDSLAGGVKFREHEAGKCLNTANISNASELFGWCPTALVFGVWDSTGPRGGMGAKFQRALVGELVGVDVQGGVKPASRIDPLGIQLAAGPLFATAAGGWTLNEAEAKKDKNGKSVKLGKDGKPSEANHGNVTPSLMNEKKEPHHGGVTMAYAQQSVVLSLPALRRLRFPGGPAASRDVAARTALAALALCGAVLSVDQGCDLRSRCLLVPDGVALWQIVQADGSTVDVEMTADGACALLAEAVAAATKAGLSWQAKPKANGLDLLPSPGLSALVTKSGKLQVAGDSGEG